MQEDHGAVEGVGCVIPPSFHLVCLILAFLLVLMGRLTRFECRFCAEKTRIASECLSLPLRDKYGCVGGMLLTRT